MVDGYINGAENLVDDRARAGLKTGATYRLPDSPWRKVWHTVEGKPSSIANARNLAVNHSNPPHLWAYPQFDWVGQTVPLDLSAYALFHDSSDPETNHRHAIQTEVFGFARDDMLAQTEIAEWLGRRVLGPVLDAGVPINITSVAPSDGGAAYGENGSVRLGWDWWRDFNGQCGHQNVPGNVHWDPGRADYLRIAQAARPAPVPPPPEEKLDMALIIAAKDRGPVLICGNEGQPIDGESRDALRRAGVPYAIISQTVYDKARVTYKVET